MSGQKCPLEEGHSAQFKSARLHCLSVALLYHSIGQIIKSVFLTAYVCVCLWARLQSHFQPIFTKFGKNLSGLNRKN